MIHNNLPNGKIWLRNGAFIAFFVVILLYLPDIIMVVKATDCITDDTGVGDFDTIQQAINTVSPGNTIWIQDGLYSQQLTINVNSIKLPAANEDQSKIYVGSYNSGIEKVEFYLEEDLKYNVVEMPYHCLCDRTSTGFFDVTFLLKEGCGL